VKDTSFIVSSHKDRVLRILAVAGARPNYVKIAPLAWQARRREGVALRIVNTGQHYDDRLSAIFFRELEIPPPFVDLGVGSASHAAQTAEVMKRFEPVVLEERPDLVLVVGDVNSTLACAITATKLNVPVAHVEAGLRSFDEQMPEEINRMLTDRISRWLFVSEPSGVENLRREGAPAERVHLVGNVMIDTLDTCRARFARSPVLDRLELAPGRYVLLTLHRPSNVDDRVAFGGLLGAIGEISRELPVIFPVHPRTAARLKESQFAVDNVEGLRLVEPLGYIDFLALQASAKLVLTDSGGVQEETTALGVPCLTLRENTERPITITQGTNRLVGSDPAAIVGAARSVLKDGLNGRKRPELWDGRAAERIFDVLLSAGA
jgi:UDP-N-acetylglucosamine 2-epimerase (non-hydrolysing)